MTADGDVQRHVVVFDCNIYLDAAFLLGPPFDWGEFLSAAAKLQRAPLPHPHDRAFDSLRALAASTSGRFAGEESLEVWTSAHIDKMVRGKAEQPIKPGPDGRRGLGWSSQCAQALVDDLVHGVVKLSSGGTVGGYRPSLSSS